MNSPDPITFVPDNFQRENKIHKHQYSSTSNGLEEPTPISPRSNGEAAKSSSRFFVAPLASNEAAQKEPDPQWRRTNWGEADSRPPLQRRPASHTFGADPSWFPPAKNKKRGYPIDPRGSPDPSQGQRSSKRVRLRNSSLKLSDLPSYSKPPGSEEAAVSPLFFSHAPRQRPTLPRFSSSDAGAAMMKKVNMEDGINVRTVRMARGSLPLGSSPPRATSTPSGRFPPQSTRISRVTTPDERDENLTGVQALGQIGILELLEQDERLCFIIDLGNHKNFRPGPLSLVFVNGPLKSSGSLLDLVRGRTTGDLTGMSSMTTFPEFKSWVTSFVKNGEAMDVSLPTLNFGGFSWTCSTLRRRFRVFYGVPTGGPAAMISSGPLTASSVLSNVTKISNRSRGVTEEIQTVPEEPADYFGNADALMPSTPVDAASAEVLSTIETPASIKNPPSMPLQPSNKSLNASSFPESYPNSGEISLLGSRPSEAILRAAVAGHVDAFGPSTPSDQGFFDWTRLPMTQALPRHIQFARSIDWAATSLGPIDDWTPELRSMCNLLMASPHPAAMYWGDDLIALYNEAYILLAGQKHPQLMGQSYSEAWKEIWDEVKDVFAAAKLTGESTMKDDDCLFVNRAGFVEEAYFSWSIIPLVGNDGSVVGLYNPAFEKTRRKVAERRMLTLREVGETTAAAREVKNFWNQVLRGLEQNEYDTPFVLLYSVADENESDASSIHSNSILGAKQCVLEGTLPKLLEEHKIAPHTIDLKSGSEGFGPVFREAMTMDKPVLLETANGTLDPNMLDCIEWRGFGEAPRAAVVCPIHPTTGDSIIGFLVMGINPRRPYDDDYNLFIQLLSRQLATSMASVVLFEEEIRRGQRAAKLAALDRIELSEQLAARTMEVVESETKFTRMAEFAPVGMFIANSHGQMVFTNDTFHAISHHRKSDEADGWMSSVKDEDKEMVERMWNNLIHNKIPMSAEFRFKTPWEDREGNVGDTWVLGSAYPEKDEDGNLKSAFGSITNISQLKWAEDYQKKRKEEAVEMKRQQSNFIDMTSHEMRNPLSAILQCADEISGSLIEFKANPGSFELPAALLDSNIDAAQTIALCANHQTRIVSDVLTLSKLDSALLLVTPVDSRPTTIVQQTLKMFEGELHTADIKMEFTVDESLKKLGIDWVRLDPSRLLQVLINLTTNAIKFTTTQAKRTITITMSASLERPSQLASSCVSYIPPRSMKKDITEGKDWGDGEGVYLNFAVRDTGKGLSDSEKKLLFLRFSQANPKTHVQYGGSGLGLFISRELVELQGGEIGVSSERGVGSTFAFYIKARRSSGPKEDKDNLSPERAVRKASMTKASRPKSMNKGTSSNGAQTVTNSPPGLAHIKVLIVEDNLVNQRVLSKQLLNQGYTVNVANHGGECIDHLMKTKHWKGHEAQGTDLSIILMDLEMPVMDGLTCTRKIRELQKEGDIVRHIPIVAVSANARNAHIESALEAGMDDVVSKPFRIPELIPKIELLAEKYGSAGSRKDSQR